jgi:hypothetical protein
MITLFCPFKYIIIFLYSKYFKNKPNIIIDIILLVNFFIYMNDGWHMKVVLQIYKIDYTSFKLNLYFFRVVRWIRVSLSISTIKGEIGWSIKCLIILFTSIMIWNWNKCIFFSNFLDINLFSKQHQQYN